MIISRRLLRTLPIVLVLIALALPAFAHGIVSTSSPPANSSVDTAPRELVLTFNEPVDPRFSRAAVLDRAGRQVSSRSAVASDGQTMTVVVSPLPAGVYTVRWRVLSALDGHTSSGAFIFAVKVQAPSPGASPLAIAGPDPWRIATRWVMLLAAMGVAGAAFFQFTVLRPATAIAAHPDTVEPARAASVILRRMTIGMALVLMAGVVVDFLLQSADLLETSIMGVGSSGVLWSLLVSTKPGWSTISRLIMAAVFLLPDTSRGRFLRMATVVWFIVVGTVFVILTYPGVATGSQHFGHLTLIMLIATVYGLMSAMAALIVPLVPDLRLPEGAWAPPVAAVILLGAITLNSHAVGSGLIAAFVDWLHLLSAAVWVGGLLPLLVILRHTSTGERTELTRVLVPRFSKVAGISLVVLLATGTYSAWLHIPSLRAFDVTPYGRLLLAKLVLVLPLVMLGAINRFVLRPRLAAPAGDRVARRQFVTSVSTEVLLAVGVFFVVSVLTITPPATVSMPAAAKPSLLLAGLNGRTRLELTISPAEPGWNRFEASITTRGTAGEAIPRVLLRITNLEENLDTVTVVLHRQPDGKFAADSGVLGLAGWWEIEVVAQANGESARTVFPLRIGGPRSVESNPAAVRLLDQARIAMDRIRTWKEVNQITDGTGGVVVTEFEVARPDRIRYRTSGGREAVLIGGTRYERDSATQQWQEQTVPVSGEIPGPYLQYMESATGIVLGRQVKCEGELCQVVLWETPDGSAAFAGWIGTQTHRVRRLLMVAPAHFMTAQPEGYDIPLIIKPPAGR